MNKANAACIEVNYMLFTKPIAITAESMRVMLSPWSSGAPETERD